jgi:hypothetical protein
MIALRSYVDLFPEKEKKKKVNESSARRRDKFPTRHKNVSCFNES